MESAYDAVVVGSGFGGGIVACRLAEHGWHVCVLERGRRFGPGDYPDRPEQAPRMFWHARHNPGGMFDLRIMKDVAVMTGAGVGGGSLVYANVQLRAPDDVFDDPAWPASLDAASLRPYYDRTEAALDPRTTPADPPLPKVRAFDAMAARAGLESERLPIAVHFGEDRLHCRRLRRLSPALGTRFSGNGDALSLAIDPQEPGVAGARTEYGPTMTSRIDLDADQGMMVADGGLPQSFGGLLQIVRGISAITGLGRVALRAKDLAARAGLSDRQVTHRNVTLDRRMAPVGDTLVFLNIGRDAADGRMRLTWPFRCLDIRWSKAASAALFDRMRRVAGELAQASGATSFFALDAGPLGKFITVHPLGGCPMSDDPRMGVVDEHGAVHGYDGLVVLDGSIVPTSLGVNPSKTIAALAERGVETLIARGRP